MIALMLHLGYPPKIALPVGIIGDLIIANMLIKAFGG